MRNNKAKCYSGLEIKPEGKFFLISMSIKEKTVTFMLRKVFLLLADKGLSPKKNCKGRIRSSRLPLIT